MLSMAISQVSPVGDVLVLVGVLYPVFRSCEVEMRSVCTTTSHILLLLYILSVFGAVLFDDTEREAVFMSPKPHALISLAP